MVPAFTVVVRGVLSVQFQQPIPDIVVVLDPVFASMFTGPATISNDCVTVTLSRYTLSRYPLVPVVVLPIKTIAALPDAVADPELVNFKLLITRSDLLWLFVEDASQSAKVSLDPLEILMIGLAPGHEAPPD